jgi:uncharacterized membrane protein YedE/YeeE
MAQRAAGAAIGLVFGVILCWSGMSSPEVIRKALLFEQSYLFLFMASAIATATIGIRLARRAQPPLRERPQRRHIVGSVIFGVGWGVADACPGPVLTQVGQGIGWAAFTFVGVVTGIYLFHRHSRHADPAVVTWRRRGPERWERAPGVR